MSTTAAPATERKEVTFFSYKEGPGEKEPFVPCSQTVAIECGGRYKDGNGMVYQQSAVFAHFNKQGIYRTADPKHIEILRKLASDGGSGITEDYEKFLSLTLPTERQAIRLKAQLVAAQEETNRLKEQMKKNLEK